MPYSSYINVLKMNEHIPTMNTFNVRLLSKVKHFAEIIEIFWFRCVEIRFYNFI